jgi:hydrogenase maturation protease
MPSLQDSAVPAKQGAEKKSPLLIAIGNTSRQDDGLGWAFAELIQQAGSFEGEIYSCYQLQIEEAELITHYDEVIFVDATHDELPNGYEYKKITPDNDLTFTTHALSPMGLLYLCDTLYHKCPEAFVLQIQGYHWELEEGLSTWAKQSLYSALEYFKNI